MYFYNHLMIKESRKTGMDSMIIQKKSLPETAKGRKVHYLELAARLKTREYDASNRNENPAGSNEYFQSR